MVLPTMGVWGLYNSSPVLGTLFLLLGCLVQPRYKGLCPVLQYILLGHVWWIALEKKQKRSESGGDVMWEERLGEVGVGV